MAKTKKNIANNEPNALVDNNVVEDKMELPNEDNIQDLQLSINKQQFRIDNDSNRILKIDTSDLGVLTRLNEYYPKLKELETKISKFSFKGNEEEVIAKFGTGLKEVDGKMREYIDKIFDANVSETCAPSGTMYDPINGQLRYEHIIAIISGLYEKNLAAETSKIKARLSKHTNKYSK